MYIFSRNSKQSVDFLWVYGKFHSFSPEYALSQFLDVGILSLTVLEYNLSPSLPQICNWCVIQHKFQDSTRVVHAISRLLPLVGNRSDALFIVIGIWFGHCRIFFFLLFSFEKSTSGFYSCMWLMPQQCHVQYPQPAKTNIASRKLPTSVLDIA